MYTRWVPAPSRIEDKLNYTMNSSIGINFTVVDKYAGHNENKRRAKELSERSRLIAADYKKGSGDQ